MTNQRKRPKQADTVPGLWGDRAAGDLTFEERCNCVRNFLADHDVHVPDHHIAVFSFCHNAAELWFVREVTSSSGWERVGERSLSNGIHKISVGLRPTGVRIPILVEDLIRGFSVAIDVQKPKHFLPSIAHRDKLRRAEIAKCADKMFGIPDYQARRIGKSFRVDLMRQRLQILQTSPIRERKGSEKFWTGGELTYDVSHVPLSERQPILADWLRAHNRFVPDPLLPVLIHCERAGELLFLLQLLTFQRISPIKNQVVIAGVYRITCQAVVGEWVFDFLVERISPGTSHARTIIEVEPATFFSRDLMLEEKIKRCVAEMGYEIIRIPAENARSVGRQWHERIANTLIRR